MILSVSRRVYQECQAEVQAWMDEAADYEFRLCDLIYKRGRTVQVIMKLRHLWQMYRDYAANLKTDAAEAKETAEARFDAIEWDNHLLRNRRRSTVRALLGLRKQHQLDQRTIDRLEAENAALRDYAGKPRFGL